MSENVVPIWKFEHEFCVVFALNGKKIQRPSMFDLYNRLKKNFSFAEKSIFVCFSDSKILPLLNFGSCPEIRSHGVTIPAYFKITGARTYCSVWSESAFLQNKQTYSLFLQHFSSSFLRWINFAKELQTQVVSRMIC